GRLVNIEGSPEKVVVEPADGRLGRVLYGSRDMAGARRGERVPLHPRCQRMYDLLGESRGRNRLSRLQGYFAGPQYQVNGGKATVDMMFCDTTARAAYLSRGPAYKVAWRKFVFGAKP